MTTLSHFPPGIGFWEGSRRQLVSVAMYLPSDPLGSGVAVRTGIAPVVWVASYPRSGNTFLRTVLHQCFGLKSGSVYVHDFGGSHAVEDVVGHIEWAENGAIEFGSAPVKLMKTHWRAPPD